MHKCFYRSHGLFRPDDRRAVSEPSPFGRSLLRIEAAGFRNEMVVDARCVHAIGDLAIFGEVVRGPMTAGPKQILQRAFPK